MDLISRLITHCEELEDIRGVSICQTSHWSGLQLRANMIRLGLLFWAVALPYYVGKYNFVIINLVSIHFYLLKTITASMSTKAFQ